MPWTQKLQSRAPVVFALREVGVNLQGEKAVIFHCGVTGQSWGFRLIQTGSMRFSMRSEKGLSELLQPAVKLDFAWAASAELVVYALQFEPRTTDNEGLEIVITEAEEVPQSEKQTRRNREKAEDHSSCSEESAVDGEG